MRAAPPSPKLWPLLWPLFLELALGMAVGLVATAMAAKVSDDAAAAFALTNNLQATLFMVFRVIGAGIGVVITQALGSGGRDAANRVALAALGASTWIGLGCALVAWGFSVPLLQLMQTPAALMPLALPFLHALAPALLLDAWNASMASVVRANLHARDTLVVLTLQNAVQLVLALIWMPQYGLVGFAWALFVSRLLAMGLHLLLWRWRLNLRPGWGDWWRLRRPEVAAMLHIGLPGAVENLCWRLAFMASLAVVAGMGSQALAAHTYTYQFIHFILLGGLAIGLSMELVIGHLIGAGRLREANRRLRKSLRLGFISGTGGALVAALCAPWLLGYFTQDAEILRQGTILLWLTVLLEPGRAFNLVVINALRAAGDARYPLRVGVGSMLVVLAGGSWLFGHVLGWGLPGVWLAYILDEWLRGLLMWRRWARLDWLPMAKASRRRVARI